MLRFVKNIFLLLLFCSFSLPIDYVPNKETAIKIAEAIWLPLFGEDIYNCKPFEAILIGDTVWYVYGTLPSSTIEIDKNGDSTFVMTFGGVPNAFIRKNDCKILNVYHSK